MPRHSIFFLSLLWVLPALALAGAPDIPDEINARIARAKSEAATSASERARDKLEEGSPAGTGAGITALDNGCTIAIGNVFEDDKKLGTSARRETTVIITGDIIQAGNNCK
ncbi:MAG: hypothetical protein ACOZB0_05785 [Pseudomonadota bacterium]